MKKVLLFFALLMFFFGTSWAYNFSAVSPSGHTLYYNIIEGGVEVTIEVTIENEDSYGYNNPPTGTLTIPSSVVYDGTTYSVIAIGNGAFANCSGLTSVTIPNSVTGIGGGAFWGCSGLTSVTIPNSVTSIGLWAFYGCSSLTSVTIPNSVTSIGDRAFYGCSILTSVTIPNSVTSIGSLAFKDCSSLAIVNFNATNCYIELGSFAIFEGCPSLTTLNIGDSVTHIPNAIFSHCSGLTSVTIPNSVTSIGNSAFAGCSGLTSVTIGNSVTSIGNYAFSGCSGLTSVTIGNSVTSIGEKTFRDCSSLTSVTIPNSVTSIGESAFNGCSSLMSITFEGRIPPAIGENAFYNVPSNVSVTIPCGTLALYMSRLPSTWNNYTETTLSFAAQSADESMGTVQVLNEPTCTNPNAVLNAVPANGYRFDHWSTGSTQNPYSLTVTTDTVITAYFVSEGGTEGIEEVGGQRSAGRVYAVEGKIVVDGAEGETVRVYDVTGRMVQAFTHSSHQALPAGVYMVKVGQHPARKVVVLR